MLIRAGTGGQILSLVASGLVLSLALRDWHLKPRARRRRGDRITNYDGPLRCNFKSVQRNENEGLVSRKVRAGCPLRWDGYILVSALTGAG
jgi:hypothetical protein